jgi:valyl-tRNA synthetase
MSSEEQNNSKPYNPREIEPAIYKLWEDSGYFNPDKLPAKKGAKPYCIIMPPPNANGSLHVGHAVFVTIEDIMTRYNRMKGSAALWLPGADHAGILTQVVYERELAKQGKTRFDLGREEFFRQTYEFSMKNKQNMENQLRELGASCDWSREKFTLDPKISEIVLGTFKRMYGEGLIYRGERIINWCPRCQTALSDLEVIHQPRKAKLYYIKYPIVNSNDFIVVATTRPETMLGDTAVAVNPKDERYTELLKNKVQMKLPLTDRVIPLIADKNVEKTFGTGAVKITPAHDPADFEIGQRHKLPTINVIGQDGKMTELAGSSYAGLKIQECRQKVLDDLRALSLLEKEEDYEQNVAICERCKAVIEPLISKQWFIKIKPLADKAIEIVKNGQIKFIPPRFAKIYFHWMKNIKDWCISRQLWWGHRIPVYYCENESCNETIVSVEKPESCPKCNGTAIKQDPDTLDTWFSSGQWPFTTLMTNQPDDFKRFYPTAVMETGWDILFFWVARMIMLGLYGAGDVPFKEVYLHGLVRDKDRQKMSKSKGNVIDPLAVVQDHGADALRMSLVFGTSAGNDIIASEDKAVAQKRFANKIWNASKFVIANIGSDFNPADVKKPAYAKEDKWILKELESATKKITTDIEKYKFHEAAQEAYHFFWHKFCDKTIEDVKIRIQQNSDDAEAGKLVLWTVLYNSLKLLHPFMPFVTEAIYQKLPAKPKELLMIEEWPQP